MKGTTMHRVIRRALDCRALLIVLCFMAVAGGGRTDALAAPRTPGNTAAAGYNVSQICRGDTFAYDSHGKPLNDWRNFSSKCLFVRSDGYVWATEQYFIHNKVWTGESYSFRGSIKLWVQDCSTGANTNAQSTHGDDWSSVTPSDPNEAAFTNIGTVIGNGSPHHSYRVIARYIHGSVSWRGFDQSYTDVQGGNAFGDSATPCYQF